MKQQIERSPETTAAQPSLHASGVDQGMRVLSYLIGGVLAYGLVGWLADRWLQTSFLLPAGIILGAGLSVYMIIKRFGRVTDSAVPGRAMRLRDQRRRRASESEQRVGRT